MFLGYPLYDEVLRDVRTEPVKGPAAFALEVFLYGFQVYRRVGSLKALRELREGLETLSPGAELPHLAAPSAQAADAPEETYVKPLVVISSILGRVVPTAVQVPATVIEEVAALLTNRAGKYGAPRK